MRTYEQDLKELNITAEQFDKSYLIACVIQKKSPLLKILTMENITLSEKNFAVLIRKTEKYC